MSFVTSIEDPLYPSVNSYMLQKAFVDLRDVPLFLSHLNNSDLMVRIWKTSYFCLYS